MNSSPTAGDRPIDGTTADVSAMSTVITAHSESFGSCNESQSEYDVIQSLLTYEVPNYLMSKFGKHSGNVQKFMNEMGSSFNSRSRKMQKNEYLIVFGCKNLC